MIILNVKRFILPGNFLTEVLKLPPEKFGLLYYEDDDEAADIWLKEIKSIQNDFSVAARKIIFGRWAKLALADLAQKFFMIMAQIFLAALLAVQMQMAIAI